MSKALELADALEEKASILGELSVSIDFIKRDAEMFKQAAAELRRLAAVEAAARNLVKVKGRYHTEQAFKALQEALGASK
jgi:hypothetical protein